MAGVYHAFIVHEPSQNKQGIQVSALLLKAYFPYKNHFEFCSTFFTFICNLENAHCPSRDLDGKKTSRF